MKSAWILIGLSFGIQAVHAGEAPALKDFAWRQGVEIEPGQPIQELPLPDEVYMHAVATDLSDLRVFNHDGGVVPHALCPAPRTRPTEPVLETLQPFPVQAGTTAVASDAGRIELRTADGTQLMVSGQGQATGEGDALTAYIFDLRGQEQMVRALRLDWHSANQASEASISIKSSEDLSDWMTLMPNATLLSAQAGQQSLQRARIPLPERPYRFLRIEAGASGPLPRIDGAVVERIASPDLVPPSWVEVHATTPDAKETATAFWFNAERRAPVHSADVRLPADNMALGVVLQSRDDPAQAWQTRWSGEVFALASHSAQRGQTVARFEPTTDRYWRLEITRGAETLRGMYPSLLLGYHPARLRFLLQGQPPYQLAYGSARLTPQPSPSCDSLLSSLGGDERSSLTGQAQVSDAPRRGNLDVLKPLPKPTPLRQILLWGALVLGAGLVAVMALSLLRQLKQE